MTDLTHLMNLANAIDNPAPGHLHSSSSAINQSMGDPYESKSPMKHVKDEPDSSDELGKPKNPLSRSQMRYVSNACFNCRALHRRCNGQKICSNCKKRGIECVYKEPTKRGPKPKGEKKNGSSDESSPPQPRRVKKEKPEPKVVDSREPLHIPQSNSPILTKTHLPPHMASVPASLFTAYNGKPVPDEKGASESKARNPTSGATTPAHFKDSFNRNDAKVLLSSVTEDLGRIFPFASAYPLDEHKAWYYWDLVSTGAAGGLTNPAQYIEMGYYCALFMHGYRCMRSDERALAFAERTEQLVKQFLFNTQGVGVPQLLTMLVTTLLLLGIFKLTTDEVDLARAFFLHAWNYLRLQNDSIHPAIYHRTIAMAVGMSTSSDDRLHWLTKAESIPKEGQTLDNRVILAFVWISPLLRETPSNLFISLPSTPVLVTSKEGMELQTMLRYLKETEEAINTGVEQMKENDRFDLDAFNAFRVIVSACRAIVLSHLGFKAQAIDAVFMAVECFEKQKRLFVADPSTAIALSYAIQVGRHFQESTLAKKGLTMLGEYNERCPIGAILYNRLIMQEHQSLLSANKLSVPNALPETPVEVKKEISSAGNDQAGSALKFPPMPNNLPMPSSSFNIVLPGISSGFTPKFFGDPMSPGGNLLGCPSPSPSPSPLPFLTGLTSSRGSFSLPPPSPSFFSPILTPNALRSSFSLDLGLGGSTTPTPK